MAVNASDISVEQLWRIQSCRNHKKHTLKAQSRYLCTRADTTAAGSALSDWKCTNPIAKPICTPHPTPTNPTTPACKTLSSPTGLCSSRGRRCGPASQWVLLHTQAQTGWQPCLPAVAVHQGGAGQAGTAAPGQAWEQPCAHSKKVNTVDEHDSYHWPVQYRLDTAG